MAHRVWHLVLAALALPALASLPSTAVAQVPPRIVIAFDTSGSMGLDLSGVPTFGDGVMTGCTRMAAGHYCGEGCSVGIDTDCSGAPDDSRMFVAGEAVTNILLSTGDDVEWGLSRFDQDQDENIFCTVQRSGGSYAEHSIDNVECGGSYTSYGNPQCNTGGAVSSCGGGLVNTGDWPAACRPGSGGNPPLQYLNASESFNDSDGNPRTNPFICLNYYPGACDGTAASGEVLVGFPDLGSFVGRSNIPAMLRWMDHRETNFVDATAVGNYCSHATTGDCELRGIGRTPLAGILRATESYIVGVRPSDPRLACRPYSVILLTDGAETCGGNAPAAATALRNAGILTYVVGLAIDSTSRPGLNAIATAGGTDAGSSGGDTAYFADDQVALSAGLADIVQRSLRFETCNGADDDCDTRIDEGVQNACGTCGAVPVETCNGADQDCDGRTDEGVSNACGGCGAVPAEICNGLDDDCDGPADEGGVCDVCTPQPEICDGIDQDCDTRIDEGVLPRSCGSNIGRCDPGTQACTAGAWAACTGATGPFTETCNNLDDDCDGVIDGYAEPCGSSVGACRPGTRVCTAGMLGTCSGGVVSTSEICNGIDDDCDGVIDDGASGTGGSCGSSLGICMPGTVQCVAGALTCVGGSSPMTESCNASDDDCDGRTDESVPTMGACGSSTGECRPGVMTCTGGAFTCVGARGPSTELCNARNDDCDGATDEGNPGGGLACGTAVGECALGTSVCTAGVLTCSGGVAPGTETCNALDDDCDGLVDEHNPGGGAACGATDVGLCELGALACVSGGLTCLGEVGPGIELCDGLDNDCDGMIDDGNPESGAMCGDGTGECAPGTTQCVAGMLACMGEVGPMLETCNALDDDCDTLVDEGTGLGEACGTDVGECVPGFNVCEVGMVVCRGAVGPMDEACNALDDDCDGSVDEGLGVGEACGIDEGLCMAGAQQCIDGVLICVGETGPTLEGCDCEDNDCDAMTDEPPPGGSLCPAGSACVECQCALPCVITEFGPSCPTGRTPVMDGAQCHCVAPRCDAAACALETVTREGEVLCGPDGGDVSECVCRNNECTFSCDGVVCSGGTVCDPRDPMGRCVEDNCRGLGCPDGQICDPASGACTTDPCDGVTCASDEACRAGTCERSCATVMCAAGERCERGVCASDPCADVTCEAGEVCDPVDGSCASNACVGVTCAGGTVCDPLTGDCDPDPCLGVRCPTGETCEAGECFRPIERPDAGVDGGIDAGTTEEDEDTRVLAAGGGGCFCTIGPGAQERGPTPGALSLALLLGLGLVLRRSMRRARAGRPPFGHTIIAALRALRLGRALGIAAIALATIGCDVDPYCLTCTEEDAAIVDAGQDAGLVLDSGPRDAGMQDAGSDAGETDGCVPGAVESCNLRDDDCDDMIDEGIDTATDERNCGACGSICAPPGAFGECVAGECTIGMCDVGRFDRDDDLTNGCETRCLPTATDDSLCDLRDNDCDFVVDEDIDLLTDPSNCERCGRTCRFVHAGATCEAGACTLGDCDVGYVDLDGMETNGCEYVCTPAAPAVETCNARDDDCDGNVDEGNPGGGGTCGSALGECSLGAEACLMGRITCTGGISPVVESCNGSDDDCDGNVDENNPEGGRLCGSSVGTCVAGREQCNAGALVCVGATPAGTESCNGLDDDCDGTIDDGDPGGGGSCGTATGECASGTNHCRGGVVACEGGVGPGTEICNGLDDDCDGMIDDGNPGGGGSCGSDVGVCRPGTQTCTGGGLVCTGATGPRAGGELCNGLDDDCDGLIDDGNPGGGASCGTSTGECSAGMQVCTGGTLTCSGATGPTTEACNGLDDDCDGTNDQTFTLASDVRNCGMCGRACALPHAIPRCSAGMCEILACDTGWSNANGTMSDGCEYSCTPSGAEACNGRDDDCDTRTDEGLTPPSNFCNPNGVCAGTSATCGGASSWECVYSTLRYQSTESRCDGLDNDCDGLIDEPFPGIGTSCANGVGECRRTGTVACNAMGTGAACNAPAAGTPALELCNDRDDDCDGAIDDGIALAQIPTVTVPRASGSGSVRIMAYEASRADATATAAGSAARLACSRPNVVPWTTVTWAEANAACCALNASGTCAGGGAGWRLCDAEDWENACEGPSLACDWGYATSCSTSSQTRCNGDEHDSAGASGDQDALYTTSSPTFPMCYADWGSATARVWDVSGNAKEWTYTEVSPGVHQIRGGSYTNVEPGRTCEFDFSVGGPTFAFPNTGFRCCNY